MITKTALKRYLNTQYQYKYERKHSLEAWLVRYLCQLVGYEISSHLKDISVHGCVSGCVSPLIYNSDITKFYNKYEPKIWELIYEYLQSTGQTIGQFLDGFSQEIDDEITLKVSLTWFCIEYLAYQFLDQFNVSY